MFCVKCGKDAKIENFCERCFVEKESLFEVPQFTMFYCDLCGVKDEDIKTEITKRVKSANSLSHYDIVLRKVGNKINAKVTCTGTIRGARKEETKKTLVILRRKMCDTHVKLSGGYYEARIQVRGPDKDLIMKHLRKLIPKKAVVDMEALKEGYDIKIMNKATAASAARALRNKFTVKDSFKLVGSKKGQKLYRNFYSIR